MAADLSNDPRIAVAGAGAIGCFVGGLLAASGAPVSFLGRARILGTLRTHGLRLTDFAGMHVELDAQILDLHEDAAMLAEADMILVCVKSVATGELAAQIAAHARPDAIIVSLQNGMGNAQTLRTALPNHDIRAGMVPFNVVPTERGGFHRATSGDIVIGAGVPDLSGLLSVSGLAVTQSERIEAIQWGKFLLNLNNAPNALSGMTLHAQLLDRSWRRLMADQMAEALRVLRANGCPIQPTTQIPVALVPHILRLPTPLFRKVAARMLTIDPQARTSMAADLMMEKPTEIDALQGRIIEMGQKSGIATPICTRMRDAVRAAERGRFAPLTPQDLRP